MNKKQLYENIMRNVSREVKKALNESSINSGEIDAINYMIRTYKKLNAKYFNNSLPNCAIYPIDAYYVGDDEVAKAKATVFIYVFNEEEYEAEMDKFTLFEDIDYNDATIVDLSCSDYLDEEKGINIHFIFSTFKYFLDNEQNIENDMLELMRLIDEYNFIG